MFSQLSVISRTLLSFTMLLIATCSLWSSIFLKSDLAFIKKGWGAVVCGYGTGPAAWFLLTSDQSHGNTTNTMFLPLLKPRSCTSKCAELQLLGPCESADRELPSQPGSNLGFDSASP